MLHILTSASYHNVAKAAIAPSFDDDDSFIEVVKQTRQALEKLDTNARLAVEAAYIFSRKAPHSERQDLFSDLVTAILEVGTEDAPFAYAIARRAYQHWWAKYKLHSQYCDGHLSETITNAEGQETTELSELIVGEVEFERKQIDRLDAQRLWSQIPANIQTLVLKRLQGKPLGTARKGKGRPSTDGALDDTERKRLNRWVKTEGYKLLIN